MNNTDFTLRNEFLKGFSKIYSDKGITKEEYLLLYQKTYEICNVRSEINYQNNPPSSEFYLKIISLLVEHVINLRTVSFLFSIYYFFLFKLFLSDFNEKKVS